MNNTTTTVHASDFSTSTADALRNRWTVGKMRHLIAALGDATVIVEIDSRTGFALMGRLTEVFNGGPIRGNRLTVVTVLEDGTEHATHYNLNNVGAVMVLPGQGKRAEHSAKWDALKSYGDERMAAIDHVRPKAEADGLTYGKWEATPCDGVVSVTYTPQREGAGRFTHFTVALRELEVSA
jgi:hypothetical protein